MNIEQLGQDIAGKSFSDYFGYSVSINTDGTVVAIGAIHGGDRTAGHVQVYERDNTSSGWGQIGLDIEGEDTAHDFSGYSVSLSSDGTIVAIGAVGNTGYTGHVRVYQRDTDEPLGWSQIGLDIDGEAAVDYSGFSVSLSSDGTVVAIGAQYNDGGGNNSGHVRVYNYDGSSWTQSGADIDGGAADDRFGYSVSLSSDGTRVAIGAPNNNNGHVKVYERDITESLGWKKIGNTILGEATGDYSGFSVSLSSDGTRVAIGAPNNDANANASGQTRIFELIGLNWTQIGSDIDGLGTIDQSGYSVSLSGDGNTVAIGTLRKDTNGPDSGQFSLYQYDQSNGWTQTGNDIYGKAAGDYFGNALALSRDGTTVIVAGYNNDDTDTDSGHVRVYSTGISSSSSSGQTKTELVADAVTGTSYSDPATVASNASAKIDAISGSTEAEKKASANTQLGLALAEFTSDSSAFNNTTTFTYANKRKVIKNLALHVFDNLDSSTTSFDYTDADGFKTFIGDSTNSDFDRVVGNVVVVKPSNSQTLDLSNDSIYCPFASGETSTVIDSGTTPNTTFVMSVSSDVFSLSVDGTSIDLGTSNQAGNVYVYNNDGNTRSYSFIWGSGTVGGGSSGGASGDPYITTISGETYKMDDFTGFARMLQGQLDNKLITLNAETKLLSEDQTKELINWRKENLNARQFEKGSQFADFPAYFDKLSVTWGEKSFVIDVNSLELETSNYDVDIEIDYEMTKEYNWSGKLSAARVAKINIGSTVLSIKSYDNRDIRNGFTLNNATSIKNRSGALEHAIYTEDMQIPQLLYTGAIKQLTSRDKHKKTVKEEFLEAGVKRKVSLNVY